MGDIFHEKADRELFFSSFGNDIGSQLDQLKFEFEAIENGTIAEEPEDVTDDVADGITLESRVQSELEKNHVNDLKEPKERHRTYTQTIQRAFSTVSLMTNFKSNFWKHRRGKGAKKPEENGRVRRGSTSSTPENNNNKNLPLLQVNGESEGRATIYSTAPRPSKKVQRSKTMSPSKGKPAENLPGEMQPIERSESGNIFVPPVVVDGQLVFDYQYATPREGSPIHKPRKLSRRNSLSRFLRLRKSPRKSPNKEKNATPIKNLYEKTVLTGSNSNLDKAGKSDDVIEVKTDNNVTKAEVINDTDGDIIKVEINGDATVDNKHEDVPKSGDDNKST